jgi:hypothetical protein
VNDGSNFLFPTLILSVYGNIRDASMAPKSPPCLSATPTDPANYGVTKEFAELYVSYNPEGLDVPQNEKEGASMINFDVSWKLATKPHPKKALPGQINPRFDRGGHSTLRPARTFPSPQHLNPQDIDIELG